MPSITEERAEIIRALINEADSLYKQYIVIKDAIDVLKTRWQVK